MEIKALYTGSDEQLLQLMRTGDEAAFEALYERYWEILFLTATRALRNADEAADVVQDVFINFWKRRFDLEIQTSLQAYLQTATRNKAIHYIEKNITRQDFLTLLTDTSVRHLGSAPPEVQLQLKQVQEVIHRAVKSMPERMRQVYELSRHEGLSYKEIAEAMNISPETVKKQIKLALATIRTALKDSNLSLMLLLFYIFYR